MPKAMEDADKLLLSLKRKLGLLDSTSSISKVPNILRSAKEQAYSPQIVSIGPYHDGKGNLPDMEKLKLQYVLHLLRRQTERSPVVTLHDCGKAIQDLDQKVRESYADDIDDFDTKKLLQILVVDGCFIIEIFYRRAFPETNLNDLIADNNWLLRGLQHDLLLLENQIPYCILVTLYNIFWKSLNIPPEHSLTSLALSFFDLKMDDVQEMKPKHLLDLLRQFWLAKSGMGQSGSKTQGFDRCASELIKAGIQLEKNESLHLLDIKFDGTSGVIKIPPLSIDATESRLRNLIALEQCDFSDSCSFSISSYALMMRSLIRSQLDVEVLQEIGILTSDVERSGDVFADVEVLQEIGILTSNVARSGDVVDRIKGISEKVYIDRSHFGELCEHVNSYPKSKFGRHWQRQKVLFTLRFRKYLLHFREYLAQLRRDYFPNPWKIIAFLAAFALLLLTGLQTYYSVYSYYSFYSVHSYYPR